MAGISVLPAGSVAPSATRALCGDSLDDCADIRDACEEALRQTDITIVRSDPPSLAPGAYVPACSEDDCVMRPGHCPAGSIRVAAAAGMSRAEPSGI